MLQDNPVLREDLALNTKRRKDVPLPPFVFNCVPELSPTVPESVHRLRPSDIKVIGAFGDSISAGNGLGADTQPGVGIENRGEVFTIGGDDSLDAGIITLTNYIRKFNPELKGYSHCAGSRNNIKKSWLNVAIPGGVCTNMPPQARDIINRMKDDPRIDMENDWKVFSLFVGGNDLCASCRRQEYSPENYGLRFREAMDILYAEVPRLYVNLIVMFDVTPLTNFSRGFSCDLLHENYCNCATNTTYRPQLRATQLGYYDELMAIQEDPKYQGRDDFAIVVQPQMRDIEPPTDPNTGEWLKDILAPDCFHPSRSMHQLMAFFLWNSMLTPVGHKTFDAAAGLEDDAPLVALCPTPERPYIFTRENSNVSWP
jgi:phospholipase B1